MTGAFSQRRIGRRVFEAYGVVMELPPDLVGRVKETVPNRAERRRAVRDRAVRDRRRSA